MRVNEAILEKLPRAKRREFEEDLRLLDRIYDENPLQKFRPHSDPQREFLEAETRVQAVFAGNRFGKTVTLVVKALIQLIRKDALPEALRSYKRYRPPCYGRIVCPDFDTLETVVIPAIREWAPRHELKDGSFDAAWDKQLRVLHFVEGSWLQFKTYKQELDQFGGSALHFVGYDEPPPKDIRRECQMRLIDFGGFEMFAMTPLMGLGWLYRDIYKQREAPHVTVIRGSIHDNPTLDRDTKEATLAEYAEDDPERRSREWGEFAHFGGMIYQGGFEHNLIDPPNPEAVRQLDTVVGIDPGLRNAAMVWIGFDGESRAFVYDEVLLQDRTPADYARAIEQTNARWGLGGDPLYVIDPSARSRALVNAESVESELSRLGIHSMPGQNDVEAGVQQVRRRLQHGMLYVSRECRGLRDEAEEYRAERRLDGEFKPVKENDHRIDALRYALMAMPWYVEATITRPMHRLGSRTYSNRVGPYRSRQKQEEAPPTGAMT